VLVISPACASRAEYSSHEQLIPFGSTHLYPLACCGIQFNSETVVGISAKTTSMGLFQVLRCNVIWIKFRYTLDAYRGGVLQIVYVLNNGRFGSAACFTNKIKRSRPTYRLVFRSKQYFLLVCSFDNLWCSMARTRGFFRMVIDFFVKILHLLAVAVL
jgi:hypothetical protein